MDRFVNADRPTTGKSERRELAPSLLSDLRDVNIPRPQFHQSSRKVITGQVEFMLVVLFRIMESSFKWGHREDEPSMPSVNRGKPEDVSKEGSVGFWILRINDDVCTIDHGRDHPGFAGLIIPRLTNAAKVPR